MLNPVTHTQPFYGPLVDFVWDCPDEPTPER